MAVTDLQPEFERLVAGASSNIEFKARFWSWLDEQRSGPLGPLLSDMVRLWSGLGSAITHAEAETLVRRLSGQGFRERADKVLARFTNVAGVRPDCDVVLVAGLRRPEGYSRFDRGRNTIFVGLDHPHNLKHMDHFELILAHELTHAVRDPSPQVLADYGGRGDMGHDEFINLYPFREHLASESLATALSRLAYPGKAEPRYIYFNAHDYAWCEQHRAVIARRMLKALREGEDYRTFYAEGSVAPGSPDCCDYYFGFHLGRYALAEENPLTLLRMPAQGYLDRFLEPFVARFLQEVQGREENAVSDGAPVIAALEPESAAASPVTPAEPLDHTVLPQDVQRFYRDLMLEMTSHPAEMLAEAEAFQEAVGRERLIFADAPYEVYAFPLVLAAEDALYIRWVTEHLLGVVEKVVELYRADPGVRGYFGFPPLLEELMLLEPGYRPYIQLGRFDSFWNGKRIRFLELNTNGTAAIVLGERLGELYSALPKVEAIVRRHRARPMPLRKRLLDTLLDAWRQARGSRDGPPEPRRIAIVDRANLPTQSELDQLRSFLESHGLEAVVADPMELAYDGKQLSAGGRPIDLVYRRLTSTDLVEQDGQLKPLLDAARDGRVVLVGSFAADVAHSKKLFAFLTDERWRRCFSMEERTLIDAHLPWTRIFRPGRTLFGGKLYDVRELALGQRERFVLKPTDGNEGRGVVLGLEAAPLQWEREVEQRFGGDHVLQEYVQAPLRVLHLPHDGRIEAVPLHMHLGEFMFGGELAGFLARASVELVLSRASRERAIPCLVLQQEDEHPGPERLSHP